METLNQIGGNLNRGISVFYEIIYLCTYSLGYLPVEKQLPPDDTGLVDVLHEERKLGSLWIVQDAVNIRDRLAPKLKKVCGEFKGAGGRNAHQGKCIAIFCESRRCYQGIFDAEPTVDKLDTPG